MSQFKNLVLSGMSVGSRPYGRLRNYLPDFLSKNPTVQKLLPGLGLVNPLEKELSRYYGKNIKLLNSDSAHNLRYLKKIIGGKNTFLFQGGDPLSGTSAKATRDIQKFLSSIPKNRRMGTPVASRAGTRVWEDKAQEAAFMKGILPDTIDVPSLAKAYGINLKSPDAGQQLMAAARKKFGRRFLFKPRTSYQSDSSYLPTYKSSPDELMESLRGGIPNKLGDILGKGPNNWVAQKFMQTKPQARLERMIEQTIDNLYGGSASSGAREYRVHAIGNRVIPGASVFRGSRRAAVPWRTAEAESVENQLQKLLSKRRLSAQHKDVPFGFDVLVSPTGKIIPIEANPATLGGASGYLSLPHQVDAVAGYLTGRVPMYLKRQFGAERALNSAGFMAPSLAAPVIGSRRQRS